MTVDGTVNQLRQVFDMVVRSKAESANKQDIAFKEMTFMKKIFATKISLQSSNPTFSYPIVRLPRELKRLTGRIANVYQTEIGGVQGFFIVLQLEKLDKFVESNGQINSRPKIPPEPVISSKHPKNRWARPDSNRRPPPCQRSF